MNIHIWGENRIISETDDSTHWQATSSVSYPTILDEAGTLNPVAIATGDFHSLLLTDYGDVYSFGRGSEGQLGHSERSFQLVPRLVNSLRHEMVYAVACGAFTSFAVTTSGKVYHWGFIHVGNLQPTLSSSNDSSPNHSVTSGQLTGLAANQESEVAIDVDARLAQESSDANAGSNETNEQDGPRRLGSILQDSTEMLLLEYNEADLEYYEKMQSLGGCNEEIEVFTRRRNKEYLTMLKTGCQRSRCDIPQLVRGLSHVRVVSVAAGYAHCMLISDNGQLYSCGYNDRGQLGLGHQIHSSEFKWVDYLADKFVIQVSCGQQHTICRAVDRPTAKARRHINSIEKESPFDDDSIPHDTTSLLPGSTIGADVFVWGNGILGQLGMGLLGTSKGRRLPTLLASLVDQFPLGIIDVSAGSNFSAVVTSLGSVYSFGHSEYNQHGSESLDSRFVDPFHYFVPRQVQFFDKNDMPIDVCMKRVCCNSNYSLGIDSAGRVYSWGWNICGVLGRGSGHAATKPTCIDKLGMKAESASVVAVAAGAKHALALSTTTSSKAADSFQYLLDNNQPTTFADCTIFADDHGLETKRYMCHRFIIAARSRYLKGYLKAEEAAFTARGTAASEAVDSQRIVAIDLTGFPGASNITVLGIVEFLYLDKVNVPDHKLGALAELANSLNLFQLRDVIVSQMHASSASYGQPLSLQQYDWFRGHSDKVQIADMASTFSEDMRSAMKSPLWGNVSFISSSSSSSSSSPSPTIVITAHKSILVQFEYFSGLLAGRFQETSKQLVGDDSSILILSLDGFSKDGISPRTFHCCLEFAYCGKIILSNEGEAANQRPNPGGQQLAGSTGNVIQYDDLTEVMSLLIAANRLGHLKLVSICEKELILNLRDPFPDNAQNCLEFACEYNFPRLEKACLETLRIGNKTLRS